MNKDTLSKIKNLRLKIIFIFNFIFIILILLQVGVTSPASGYEASIYDAYPWIFWALIIATICLSTYTTLEFAVSKESKNLNRNRIWLLGLLAIFIIYFIFLFLPTLRGYAFYWRGTGDILDHIGWARAILKTGFIEDDFYPIIHILIVNFNFIGISLERSANLIPIIFSLFFILFTFLLAKAISEDQSQTLFILAFSFPLLFSYFHLTVHPSILSLFMVPLLLFCYHKRNSSRLKTEFTILALILAFLIVFFHPITTIIVIIIFSVFFFGNSYGYPSNLITENKNIKSFILILVVSFLAWVTSFYSGIRSIGKIFNWLIYNSEIPIIANQLSTLSKAEFTLLQTAKVFTLFYGQIFIYLVIAVFCTIYIMINIRKREIISIDVHYGFQFIAGIIFCAISIFGYVIEYEPVRVARYALLMAMLICGMTFFKIFNRLENVSMKRALLSIIFIIICTASILGIFNTYPSPLTYQMNQQATHMEMNMVDWFLNNRNIEFPLLATSFMLYKYECYFFGFDEFNLHRGIQIEEMIPSHFGYDKNRTLSTNFNYEEVYMIINEINKQAIISYPENIRAIARVYSDSDYIHLSLDPSIAKIYTNRESEIWLLC